MPCGTPPRCRRVSAGLGVTQVGDLSSCRHSEWNATRLAASGALPCQRERLAGRTCVPGAAFCRRLRSRLCRLPVAAARIARLGRKKRHKDDARMRLGRGARFPPPPSARRGTCGLMLPAIRGRRTGSRCPRPRVRCALASAPHVWARPPLVRCRAAAGRRAAPALPPFRRSAIVQAIASTTDGMAAPSSRGRAVPPCPPPPCSLPRSCGE